MSISGVAGTMLSFFLRTAGVCLVNVPHRHMHLNTGTFCGICRTWSLPAGGELLEVSYDRAYVCLRGWEVISQLSALASYHHVFPNLMNSPSETISPNKLLLVMVLFSEQQKNWYQRVGLFLRNTWPCCFFEEFERLWNFGLDKQLNVVSRT